MEGFVGCAVEFELEDVDKVVGLNDAVGASLAQLLFGIDHIGAYEAQDEVECVVEIALTLVLIFLASHGVRNTGEEGCEILTELFQIAALQGLDQ